jgi:hypothetical protein
LTAAAGVRAAMIAFVFDHASKIVRVLAVVHNLL